MPIFDTGMIPLNGGVDERPDEYKPANTVSLSHNFIATPDGTYRRPPWSIGAIADDVILNVCSDLITDQSLYIGILDDNIYSVNYQGNDSLLYIAQIGYNSYNYLVTAVLNIFNDNPGAYSVLASSYERIGVDLIPKELSIKQLDDNDILIYTKGNSLTLGGVPYPSTVSGLFYFDTLNLNSTYSITMEKFNDTSGLSTREINATCSTDTVEETVGTTTVLKEKVSVSLIVNDTVNDVDNGSTSQSYEYYTDKFSMGKLIEIIYGRVGDFVSNSHLVNGKIVIVDSNLRSITVDADNGGGHAYVDIVPSLGTLPVSLGDYDGPTPIFGIGDPESTSYYVSWSFKYSRWIETKKTATPIEETVGTTTTRTWEPHPWEIFANGWYIFNMEDKLISTLEFAPRYVGDKDTAPPPSFASFTSPNATYNGYDIVDVFRFQGRLAILTEQTVVLSRIDDEFNFWPSTASKVLPTDPIDIKIGEGLKYAVPWQNRILIFGKNQQYVIDGSGGFLSPETISVTPTTSYSLADVRPVSLGDSVMFLDGEYNILEYTTGFEAVQTKAYEVSKYFKPIAVRKPTGRLTISADNHWVFIPETGVVYLEKKGDSLVRLLSTEDSLDGNGVFVGNTLYCLGSTYSKLISYQDLTNITELIETADSLGEIHIDYPEPITNSLSGVVTSANYDATNDITKVILDYNASRDWVLFDSNTGIVYDDYEGVVIDGVYERHYSGNLYTSNIMVGSKYSSNMVLSKYIPRDSNDKPMHFKRLTYKLGEIFYQGYAFSVSYGRGKIGYLPYSITTPEAYLNESNFNSSTVDSRKLRFSMRGYDGINIFIESESIHPLLIKGIRYEITYFRGR